MNKTVLVIDDEQDLRELLCLTLSRMDITATAVETIAEAKHQLAESRFDLCLTGMRLPDGSGLDLVSYVQQQQPQMPIAVITAYGSMELAVEALKQGAFDFLSKPIELPRLRQLVGHALVNTNQQATATEHLLLGNSDLISQVRSQITKVARSQAPMFISGESGIVITVTISICGQPHPATAKYNSLAAVLTGFIIATEQKVARVQCLPTALESNIGTTRGGQPNISRLEL